MVDLANNCYRVCVGIDHVQCDYHFVCCYSSSDYCEVGVAKG